MRAFLVAALVAFVFVLFPFASAASGVLVGPVERVFGANAVIDLGVVGPGQTVELQVLRDTRDVGAAGQPSLWDQLVIVPASLPPGWRGEPSRTFENPLKAFVVLPRDAAEGAYAFDVTLVDANEGTPPVSFKANVVVSRDVLGVSAEPLAVRAGVDQPGVFTLSLHNTGRASDVFEVSAVGLPSRWDFVKRVFVPHDARVTLNYEVVAGEAGEFPVRLTVTSLSSDLITRSVDARLVAEASLLQDAKSAANGILLFPSAAQAFYALLGLLANAFA